MSGETGFTFVSEGEKVVVQVPEGEAGKFYMLPANLQEQLEARASIRSVVESFWLEQGWGLPPIPFNQPLGILPRQVATARFEDLYFMTLCEQAGLVPCWLELIKDKFVSKSSYKVGLLSPHLFDGKGRSGGPKLRKVVLAKGPECEGKPLSQIMTKDGVSLIDWHHQFRKSFFNGHLHADTSDWLLARGGASEYYFAYLTLFLGHGICFDLLHGGESGSKLNKLCHKAFYPAWEKINQTFGCQPLIFPLPWADGFAYYPARSQWQELGIV